MRQASSTNILSLDLSMAATGYCVLRCYSDGDIEIAKAGLLSTDKDSEDEDRICKLAWDVAALARLIDMNPHKVFSVIEKPRAAYGGKKTSFRSQLAKGNSLFKVFMAYGAVFHELRKTCGKCIQISPVQWESKIKQKGRNIKEVSLELANKRLQGKRVSVNGISRSLSLETKLDQNIADAINIGFYAWQNWEMLRGNIGSNKA